MHYLGSHPLLAAMRSTWVCSSPVIRANVTLEFTARNRDGYSSILLKSVRPLTAVSRFPRRVLVAIAGVNPVDGITFTI